MLALKAQWAVYAGLFLGEDMPGYTKAWQYTSKDWQEDGDQRGLNWCTMAYNAHAYLAELEAGGLNHARLEYLWL